MKLWERYYKAIEPVGRVIFEGNAYLHRALFQKMQEDNIALPYHYEDIFTAITDVELNKTVNSKIPYRIHTVFDQCLKSDSSDLPIAERIINIIEVNLFQIVKEHNKEHPNGVITWLKDESNKLLGDSTLKVFISHLSLEESLARYLGEWLEKHFHGVKCFCSSRPFDLPPGEQWFINIRQEASGSYICLVLLSPHSSENVWLHFEAGMVLGAKPENKLVPVLYGVFSAKDIPPTLIHHQALFLNKSESFNAFLAKTFLGERLPQLLQNHDNFIQNMPQEILRLLKYGHLGLLSKGTINTETYGSRVLNDGNDRITFPKDDNKGRAISIRTTIIPRRMSSLQRWKFGVALSKNSKNYFQFHCGCHDGITTWSIYLNPA